VDTHRTPIFYASKTWNTLFGLLVAGSLVSMLISALAYTLGALFIWEWVRWVGLAAAAMEVFALVMTLHADFTPFSPGANDNASGVGVILGLAGRTALEPLTHTEVWLAFTGCEEAASYGMLAFLDSHADELGMDTVYIIIDQVGFGHLCCLTTDGLVRKHSTHPRALELARAAAAVQPDIITTERVGLAYTDAVPATKRGLVALTLCALPPAGSDETIHWHQMTDTIDHVDPQALADTHAFVWQILKDIDHT
jgi:Zn-dependent M28 family amino/carboxypeptidase